MFRLTLALALFGCAFAGVSQLHLADDLGGRVVGGEDADIANYPYQVALLKDGSLFCGGSIYNEKVIITAAHCMQSYTASQIKVRAGSSLYASGGELVSVKTFKYHEAYDSSKMINDVAIIVLETPLVFSKLIKAIPLAEVVPAAKVKAVVTGWGTDRFIIGSIQSNLQVAELDIVPLKECQSTKYGTQILETMVCAHVDGGGKDACQGDSGGPLASGGELVGIVSWGSMCARKEYPGVYASVPDLREWIIKTAKELAA